MSQRSTIKNSAIAVSIPERLLRRLDARANARGMERDRYIQEVLERDLESQGEPARGLFDELTAPLRQQFRESGMSEEELDALIETAREEVWQERMKNSAPDGG